MAMVNPINPMMGAANFNVKDSRWLTLEVCREFQRSKCTRPETECKFAHPPPHVEVQNGRVTCCFDSIKGKCQRKDPPCKYLHPPQHLREQLLQNGKNNLILKNLQMQVAQAYGIPPMVPGMIPVTWGTNPQPTTQVRSTPQWSNSTVQTSASMAGSKVNSLSGGLIYAHDLQSSGSPDSQVRMMAHPYFSPVQTAAAFSPYNITSPIPQVPGMVPTSESQQTVAPSAQVTPGAVIGNHSVAGPPQPQKVTRTDRLEVCRESQRGTCTRQPSECRFAHPPDHVTVDTSDNQVTVCMDYIKGKCSRDACRYYHPPPHLQAQIKASQQRGAQAPNLNSQTDPSQDSSHNCVQCISNPQVVEVLKGKKRPLEPSDDLLMGMPPIPGMVPYVKRPAVADAKSGLPMYQPGTGTAAAYQQAALAAMQLQQGQAFVPVSYPVIHGAPTSMLNAGGSLISNTQSVNYFDDKNQLLDTLPVCRDFKSGQCVRQQCKYVHLIEDYVEVTDGKVTVCRDAAKGKCTRPMCKYYHVPILPQAVIL